MKHIVDRALTELFGPKLTRDYKAPRARRRLTRREIVNRQRREQDRATFGPVAFALALAAFIITAYALFTVVSVGGGVSFSTHAATATPDPCRAVYIDKGADKWYCYKPEGCS